MSGYCVLLRWGASAQPNSLCIMFLYPLYDSFCRNRRIGIVRGHLRVSVDGGFIVEFTGESVFLIDEYK
jgi:hypothetical protein